MKNSIKIHQTDEYEIFTNEIRTRLKTLQAEHKYTNAKIAAIIGVKPDTYKNMTRRNGLKKFSEKYIYKFSNHYNCTRDYILCKSNIKTQDCNGVEKIVPIDFHAKEDKIADLVAFFHHSENTEILRTLHFFLIKLTPDFREHLIKVMISTADLFKTYGLVFRKDDLDEESLLFLSNVLKLDNPELTAATIQLAEADSLLGKKRRKNALLKYLEIVYYASTNTYPVVKEALRKIFCLENNWGNYPAELKNELHDKLTKMADIIIKGKQLQEDDDPYTKLFPDIQKLTYDYLVANSAKKPKSREEYFLSFY